MNIAQIEFYANIDRQTRSPARPLFCAAVVLRQGNRHRQYLSAGDHCPRIARRLAVEIILMRVDDDRPADHIGSRKPIRQHGVPRVTRVSEQRRQVARVKRMFTAVRVKMPVGVCERIGGSSRATASRVDMQRKYRQIASTAALRQAVYVGNDVNSLLRLIKTDGAADIRILRRAFDESYGGRLTAPQREKHIGG